MFSFISFVVIASVMIFIGCAKPPTEKVTALQGELKNCETQGARVFAPDQYAQVANRMAELQNMMAQKKYRQATALADSLKTDMAALVTATATNAKKIAEQNVAGVSVEIEKMKSLLTPENIKLLGQADTKAFQDETTAFEGQFSALKNDLGNSAFLKVYNDSKPLKDKIAISIQNMNQKLETAKAKEMEKATKGKAKAKAPAKPAPAKPAPKKK